MLWLLDKTKTSMGARLFRTYLDQPLKDSAEIDFRLDGVEELTKNLIMRDRIKEALNEIYDIERLSGKIGYGNATPRDLMSLGISLNALPKLKEALISVKSKCLLKLLNGIGDFSTVADLLKRAIMDNPPVSTREGGYIANNFNDDLDKIRDAKKHGKERVKELEKRGARTVSSVTGRTTHLLAGQGGGSKRQTAEKLGVRIVSEDEFLAMLGQEGEGEPEKATSSGQLSFDF